MPSKVYFIKDVTAEAVVKMYDMLGISLPGKVAVKVHSGEEGNQNYLKPEFWKPMVEHVKGTIVECNTAYEGERNYTDKLKSAEKMQRTLISLLDKKDFELISIKELCEEAQVNRSTFYHDFLFEWNYRRCNRVG